MGDSMKLSILFDLDGTLWDPSNVSYMSWKNVVDKELKNYTITKEQLQNVTGMTTTEISNTLFPNLDKEKGEEITYNAIIGQNDIIRKYGDKLYDNVIEVLNILAKDNDLYIVSNAQKGYIESFLEYYKINHLFKDYECYGNNGLDKKDNIKLIIDKYNIKNTVYVGDTSIDYNSAKYNNIPFIYCSYGFGEVNHYDYKIDKFNDLISVINDIKNEI